MTRDAKRCMVESCSESVHAKGYCRRHYGQIWRKGKITDTQSYSPERPSRADAERLRALERELKKAGHMYSVVVGVEGRVRWRREVEQVRTEISKIASLVSDRSPADAN